MNHGKVVLRVPCVVVTDLSTHRRSLDWCEPVRPRHVRESTVDLFAFADDRMFKLVAKNEGSIYIGRFEVDQQVRVSFNLIRISVKRPRRRDKTYGFQTRPPIQNLSHIRIVAKREFR